MIEYNYNITYQIHQHNRSRELSASILPANQESVFPFENVSRCSMYSSTKRKCQRKSERSWSKADVACTNGSLGWVRTVRDMVSILIGAQCFRYAVQVHHRTNRTLYHHLRTVVYAQKRDSLEANLRSSMTTLGRRWLSTRNRMAVLDFTAVERLSIKGTYWPLPIALARFPLAGRCK